MRTMRGIVLGALAFKVVVLGSWWWQTASAAAKTGEPTPESAVPGDLLARSHGFRELLDAVRRRGTELEQREQALGAREAALKGLEKTLADEVTRLEALARGGGLPAAAGVVEAGGVPVEKVYASMKPDEAGPIFDKLDEQVALGILVRMKEKQIGAILAAMSRDRAVVLTRLLAETGR